MCMGRCMCATCVRIYTHVSVCIWDFMHVFTRAHEHDMYLYTQVTMYIYTCVLLGVACTFQPMYVNVCAYMCTQVHMFVCLHAREHFHTFMLGHVYIHACMCVRNRAYLGGTCVHVYVRAQVCPHLGMGWDRGDGTIDSRNNLLSFQAMRPSAHQISTSSVPTTHWVCAACSLSCLSVTLLFTSLSPLHLTTLALLLSVSSWGFFLGVEPYPIPPGV